MPGMPDRPGGEPPIIAIVGPTATGKTDVAVAVAGAVGGEIISADSVAVYRGMDIGSAKPDAEARRRAPFHVLDVAEPDEAFSVARFKELAEGALAGIRSRGHRPIVVGGTGLYVRVLLDDYGLTATPADPALRAALDAEAEQSGVPALHERLAAVDPQAAARIHRNDRVRIVRALEVIERTGRRISDQQAQDAASRKPRPAARFALTASRDELYRRIDARVDAMVAAGLVEEVRSLIERGFSPSLTPLRSLGYKELVAYLSGECSLAEAVEEIKRNTRRFAKRQLTWLRADKELTWLDVGGRSAEQVAGDILARLPAH